MKESKVKNENYIVIQGFMVNELKLKGNELLIYSIIYGFSQDGEQVFNGSLQYLADWTNSTKQGVSKNLKSLVDKGYIIKQDKYVNGVKFCEYYVTKFNRVCNNVEQGMQQSLMGYATEFNGGMQQSCINNLDNNLTNKIDNIIELKDSNIKSVTKNNADNIIQNNINGIIDYLNFRVNANYKSTTRKTKDLIKARFNEGFTIDDFKIVIDKKTMEWINDNKMKIYLRPETLFGTKFESYLNQPVKELTTSDLAPNIDFSEFYSNNGVSNGNLF